MSQYLISFNQQWVGDHSEDWFRGRGPLARAVVEEMRIAGVLVFAGGLEEEIDQAIGIDVVDGHATFLGGRTKCWHATGARRSQKRVAGPKRCVASKTDLARMYLPPRLGEAGGALTYRDA